MILARTPLSSIRNHIKSMSIQCRYFLAVSNLLPIISSCASLLFMDVKIALTFLGVMSIHSAILGAYHPLSWRRKVTIHLASMVSWYLIFRRICEGLKSIALATALSTSSKSAFMMSVSAGLFTDCAKEKRMVSHPPILHISNLCLQGRKHLSQLSYLINRIESVYYPRLDWCGWS